MSPRPAAFKAADLTIFAFAPCGLAELGEADDTSPAGACVKARRHANPARVGQRLISTPNPWIC